MVIYEFETKRLFLFDSLNIKNVQTVIGSIMTNHIQGDNFRDTFAKFEEHQLKHEPSFGYELSKQYQRSGNLCGYYVCYFLKLYLHGINLCEPNSEEYDVDDETITSKKTIKRMFNMIKKYRSKFEKPTDKKMKKVTKKKKKKKKKKKRKKDYDDDMSDDN